MKKIIALLLVAVMCFSLTACGGDKEDKNEANLVGKWTGTYRDGTAYTMILNEDGTGTLESEYGKNELQWQAGTCQLYSEKEDLCINVTDDGHKEFELTIDGDTLQLKMGDFYQFTKEK